MSVETLQEIYVDEPQTSLFPEKIPNTLSCGENFRR
jgi:hypothetical protein